MNNGVAKVCFIVVETRLILRESQLSLFAFSNTNEIDYYINVKTTSLV